MSGLQGKTPLFEISRKYLILEKFSESLSWSKIEQNGVQTMKLQILFGIVFLMLLIHNLYFSMAVSRIS